MTIQMTATEFRAKVLSLLDRVADGEEIEVTKHGRTVARLVAARGKRRPPGWLRGVAVQTAPDEALYSTGEKWDSS